MNEKTKMIFRKFPKNGEVIAILPEVPGTNDPNTCMSYMHIGQHGNCEPVGLVKMTIPTNQEEIFPLIKELTSIGYEVEQVKRNDSAYFRKRLEAIQKCR